METGCASGKTLSLKARSSDGGRDISTEQTEALQASRPAGSKYRGIVAMLQLSVTQHLTRLAKSGNVHALRKALKDLSSYGLMPTTAAKNRLLTASQVYRRYTLDDFLMLYRQLDKGGSLKWNTDTADILIHICLRGRFYEEARFVLKEGVARGVLPSSQVASMLVRTLTVKNRFGTLFEVLQILSERKVELDDRSKKTVLRELKEIVRQNMR